MNKEYGNILLNALVDKYENSQAFCTGTASTRRVLLKLYDKGKCDFPLYNIEQSDVREKINQAVLMLEKRNLLFFEWMRGEKNHILALVWLNVDAIADVYQYLNRTPKNDEIDEICVQLLYAMEDSDALWAKQFLQDTYEAISTKRTIGKRLPADAKERKDLLHCISFASKPKKAELLERVFSMQCFGDSKHFEKAVRSRLLGILRRYLEEEDDTKDDDLLRQIGIAKYPEQFEFCGRLSLVKSEAVTSFSNLQYGAAVFRSELDGAQFVLDNTVERLISIENKANFIDYIHNQRKENELVVFHGGQYSPAKKKFFKMLAAAMPLRCIWEHWGDIDYGGFSMLARLRREICPEIKAFRMGIKELVQYEALSVSFAPAYGERLQRLLFCEEVSDCHDCIRFMLNFKRKLEQEALLAGKYPL